MLQVLVSFLLMLLVGGREDFQEGREVCWWFSLPWGHWKVRCCCVLQTSLAAACHRVTGLSAERRQPLREVGSTPFLRRLWAGRGCWGVLRG